MVIGPTEVLREAIAVHPAATLQTALGIPDDHLFAATVEAGRMGLKGTGGDDASLYLGIGVGMAAADVLRLWDGLPDAVPD